MGLSFSIAMVCTVALLMTTTYFLLGSLPLLVLRHDTPMDARFVRAFFNTYYVAATGTALATAVSLAWAGLPGFALGAGGLAGLAFFLRRKIMALMDELKIRIPDDPVNAIPQFRRTHVLAILVNIFQLVVIVWGLIRLSI